MASVNAAIHVGSLITVTYEDREFPAIVLLST